MSKLRYLIFLLLMVMLLLPMIGTAQNQPQITNLEIALWPDYDRPEALVIYQVRLAQDTPMPAIVRLPIPAEVGQPHAVAAWSPDGSLDDSVTWTTTSQGDWTLVEILTETHGVWLEFYDDLTMEGGRRSYAYSWPGGIEVDSLNFEVLHPVGASDIQVSPEGEVRTGTDGLDYSRLDLGARGAEQEFSIEISYAMPAMSTESIPTLRPNPTFAGFEVGLWPEYDQLSTLVIFRGGISPDVSYPVTLSLPIPASAGDPSAVATLGSDERLYLTEYERQVEGEWAWITFEAESAVFQLEYYDDLVFDGALRTFTFSWPGLLATDSFAYELQQPVGAGALQVTPAGVMQVEADGLAYIRANLGAQQPISPLMINFQYEKTSSELTASIATSDSSIARPTTTQGGTPDLTAQLPLILGGFGILLIVLGIVLYSRSQRQEKSTRKRQRQRKTRSKPKPEQGGLDAAAVFCHTCGAKASASDHFCRTCGTKLRT
jgi:hypothetical protein